MMFPFKFCNRLWRFWRRSRLVNFSRVYYKRGKSYWRLLRSNKLAVRTLALVIALSLWALVYFTIQSRNEHIVNFKFLVGWWKTVYISVSVLDVAEHVNFPNEILKLHRRGYSDQVVQTYLQGDRENSLIWKVDGFTKYLESASELDGLAQVPGRLSLERTYNRSGYWIFSFGRTERKSYQNDTNEKGLLPSSAIRAFKITEHLATARSIPPESLEVAIALRAYIEGEAAVMIRYEDSVTKRVQSKTLPRKQLRRKQFCYEILDVPFDKRINSIYIRPTSTNLRKSGLVFIDQIIIVVATRNVTESMIHTMVPENWC